MTTPSYRNQFIFWFRSKRMINIEIPFIENDNLSQRLRMDVESTTSLAPKAAFERFKYFSVTFITIWIVTFNRPLSYLKNLSVFCRENIPAKSCRELWKLRDPSPQLTSKKEPVHHRVNPVQTVSQPQNTVKKPITNEENPQQSELHKLAKASTNMICVSGHFYQVMGVLGDGGSSRVYDVCIINGVKTLF